MNQVTLPFDPAEILLQGLINGLGMAVQMVAAWPWWLWALMGLVLAIRLFSRPRRSA